jgi:hypothetical protein
MGLAATVVGSVAGVAAVGVGVWQTVIAMTDSKRRKPGQEQHEGGPDTGAGPATLNLTGQWWAAWQTWNQGQALVATQPVEMEQEGSTVRIRAIERSEENVRGGYVWTGELRIWDNHVLMGWYAAEDQNVRSKGTFFFVLHPQGHLMEGRWAGTSYDGPIVHGWAGIARDQDEAAAIIERLKDRAASEDR